VGTLSRVALPEPLSAFISDWSASRCRCRNDWNWFWRRQETEKEQNWGFTFVRVYEPTHNIRCVTTTW